MTCSISNNSPIRNLYIECQTAILDQYTIPIDKRTVLNNISYLVIALDSSDYTRIEQGEKSNFTDTFRTPFITPKQIRVGFSARIADNMVNVRRCLEFLAISSVSTSYSGAYIPVTVVDYVRPEYSDTSFTIRKGLLTISAGTGYSGASLTKPVYTNDYEITFI